MSFLLVVCLLLRLGQVLHAGTEAATVRFAVFAADGTQGPMYRVHEFYDSARKADLSDRFDSEMRARRVPFGQYTYTLLRVGAKNPKWTTLKGRVHVLQLRQRITLIAPPSVGLDDKGIEWVAHQDLVGNRLTGNYGGLLPGQVGRLWVRLYSPISGASAEVELDRDGAFSFAQCPPGENVLLLMEGNSVLQADPISAGAPFGREITVTLVRR